MKISYFYIKDFYHIAHIALVKHNSLLQNYCFFLIL